MTGALSRLALPLALLVLNTAAHFLPLERASVAPDDYVYLVRYEDWGLLSMTRLAAQDRTKKVHLAVEAPVRLGDEWRFVEGENTGSRSFETRPVTIPSAGTVVLSFRDVFGRELRNGRGRW